MVDERAIQRLQEISPSGVNLVAQLISLFQAETPTLISEMKRSLAAHDFQAIGKSAHILKSTAANLGAIELRDISERIEFCSGSSSTSEIEPLLSSLEAYYPVTIEQLFSLDSQRGSN